METYCSSALLGIKFKGINNTCMYVLKIIISYMKNAIQYHFPLVFVVSGKTHCLAVFVYTTPQRMKILTQKASSPIGRTKKEIIIYNSFTDMADVTV